MRKALFLDRDGVINEDTGYVCKAEDFRFRQGLFPFLRAVQDRGYCLVLVTNQGGVARGYYKEEDFLAVTRFMEAELAKEGISFAKILSCFEYEKGQVEPYVRNSFWRKPNPGMILEAARALQIDLGASAMLGDRDTDMQAALAAGVGRSLWINAPKGAGLEGVTNVTTFDEALAFL